MKLSIIGMSGGGKSHWSKKLEKEKGYQRFCCDNIIEKKLSNELKKFGYSGLQDMAKWMGQPFDPQYKERSKQYLYFEKESIEEIIEAIEDSQNQNIIIDTTGSIIYTGNDILKKLSNLTKIIYLDTSERIQQKMYRQYIDDPKPVIWDKSFYKINGESDKQALRRCYPELLAFRSKKYESITNVKFDYNLLRNPNFGVEKFIEIIEKND